MLVLTSGDTAEIWTLLSSPEALRARQESKEFLERVQRHEAGAAQGDASAGAGSQNACSADPRPMTHV